ncbi:hypothetical protein HK103_003100 [Boothiomyces macroporosus]|uniref:Uncharacterized protein n=1 Tax=Boothiomyces macroporosus TaxID=261099 RepID=A0AAD5Y4T1_9FUNG|nr:hypothetical protein HK103_003100 [Boothiomyces macroporosus]
MFAFALLASVFAAQQCQSEGPVKVCIDDAVNGPGLFISYDQNTGYLQEGVNFWINVDGNTFTAPLNCDYGRKRDIGFCTGTFFAGFAGTQSHNMHNIQLAFFDDATPVHWDSKYGANYVFKF